MSGREEKLRPVLYDLTRLSGRFFSPTPGGIDRMDFAYAKHFLSDKNATGLNLSVRGPAVMAAPLSQAILANVGRRWEANEGAARRSERFDTLQIIERWLGDATPASSGSAVQRLQAPPERVQLVSAIAAYAGIAIRSGSPVRNVPRDALYLNISQFPLWSETYARWLDARPDVAFVAMIHDLLPLQYPEYFLAREQQRHERRLALLARRGAGAIVSTAEVARALSARLERYGRADLPIHVAHLPVSKAFTEPTEPEGLIQADTPYFVVCGTIEPRKNHLMLLQLWREMAATMGAQTPRLIIVGRRGWDSEAVFRLLDRSVALSSHVLEVNGLSTLLLRHLLANAQALLVPSLAEGFGLPVAEGRAAGVPIIASDIPVFREIGGSDITYVHPLDLPGWSKAIARAMRGELPVPTPPEGDESTYFKRIEAFLATV